jgi:hypothetical protein
MYKAAARSWCLERNDWKDSESQCDSRETDPRHPPR